MAIKFLKIRSTIFLCKGSWLHSHGVYSVAHRVPGYRLHHTTAETSDAHELQKLKFSRQNGSGWATEYWKLAQEVENELRISQPFEAKYRTAAVGTNQPAPINN
jgi:hypothetical protein